MSQEKLDNRQQKVNNKLMSILDKYKDIIESEDVEEVRAPVIVESASIESVSDALDVDKEEMLRLIKEQKLILIKKIDEKLAFIDETKELKDIATVLDMLEKGITKSDDTGNINLIVQNLLVKYGS